MKAEYSYNSKYLLKNEKPWFPVMGEMHYTRFKPSCWEESLRKIKAGGVSVVSSYIIWIHHEEEKERYDFDGCRNLRGFLQLCKKVQIDVFLRLGPWVHAEVRNGGFPDWLMEEEKNGVHLRSNHPEYLAHVTRFWKEIYQQVDGFLYHQGGPVIGIQIENEYGHVGGLRGEEGEAHMRTLTKLAREIGFEAPLYTATGWGGACIGDLLPVMGGYCEAPWDQRITEIEANPNYVFSHVRNDSLIACDHHVEDAVTFDESKFPFLTAELGGGLQVTRHRRPVATGKDLGAMSLTKLGSGVALLGYYMYHGGSNPKGKLSTLQESTDTGYLNDLPEINYDFNAPIRQYGQISDSYREIKLLAYFLKDFGEDFATLISEIPGPRIKPEDLETLRVAIRHDDTHGYVFYNNYQRRRTMMDHFQVKLKGIRKNGDIEFPLIDIISGSYGFFPYHLKLGEHLLISAIATPLCEINTEGEKVYVFYGDLEPHFVWENEESARVIHISRADALNAWKISMDQEYLIIADNYVWEENDTLKVTGSEQTTIKCYPKLQGSIPGFVESGTEGVFTVYQRTIQVEPTQVRVEQISCSEESKSYEISMKYPSNMELKEGQEAILYLTYEGESLDIYCNQEKINDHLFTGQEVPVRLGYFDFPDLLRVDVHQLTKNHRVFIEDWPQMKEGKACDLVSAVVRYEFH